MTLHLRSNATLPSNTESPVPLFMAIVYQNNYYAKYSEFLEHFLREAAMYLHVAGCRCRQQYIAVFAVVVPAHQEVICIPAVLVQFQTHLDKIVCQVYISDIVPGRRFTAF